MKEKRAFVTCEPISIHIGWNLVTVVKCAPWEIVFSLRFQRASWIVEDWGWSGFKFWIQHLV